MYKIVHNVEEIPDVALWKKILGSMPEPKDGIDCAYNKFRCRRYYFSPIKRIVMNVGAFFMLLGALPRLLGKSQGLPPVDNNNFLLIRGKRIDYADVIPQELYSRFDEAVVRTREDAPLGFLCREGRELFWECIRRHPLCFWFQLLVLKELSANSKLLLDNNVKAAVGYVNESSIAFPVVTDMCERTGRKFISFMHGEYLLQIIHGFMRFSEYYVWDSAYVEMFARDLRCSIGAYKIYTPGKLRKKWNLEEESPTYVLTYYFSGESKTVIRNVARIFGELQEKGVKCKVRPHPRFVLNVQEIFDTFHDVEIELPAQVSLRDSLARTKYAVGLASTVLSEAYIEGRGVVADDMSDPDQFESLYERNASVLKKEHLLLSELYKSAANGAFGDHEGKTES